jgi:hypothetical protein
MVEESPCLDKTDEDVQEESVSTNHDLLHYDLNVVLPSTSQMWNQQRIISPKLNVGAAQVIAMIK